ncbi:6-bladed beta-propeller [Parabacteroides sp. OttesenSCG-928-J18]|nr:6-bladed beta-propeller [Parabacteroides sp. OttesenSCG-928-J18]
MKKTSLIILILALLTAGCKKSTQSANQLITVDVTTHYPKKELVLQDFMEVEYLALETTDEFLTQGAVMAIGKEIIVVKNWVNDGDIFLFDRQTGKGIRKINRKGQSGEEYSYINGVVLDEENDELFINCSSTNKIFVYDLQGHFKRSFGRTEDITYLDIFSYDKDHLICYDISGYYRDGEERGDQSFHSIISKQDGNITQEIYILFKVINSPGVRDGDGFAVTSIPPIIPNYDNWLFVETSSDTIYQYLSKENQLVPLIVRTPSTQTMDPEILLTMGVVTDRYYFMRTVTKVFNFATGKGFDIGTLMYDKQENALYDHSILNGDYQRKQWVDLTSQAISGEIATYQVLAAHQLVEDYENNQLKGKLKEIAADLDEEANPVVMVMKPLR